MRNLAPLARLNSASAGTINVGTTRKWNIKAATKTILSSR